MTTAEAKKESAAVAEQATPVALRKASPKKDASKHQAATKARKTGHSAPGPKAKNIKKEVKRGRGAKATNLRSGSKGAKILEMIGHTKGATLAELMKATSWQAHSIRGFLSTAAKKHRVKIESAKNQAGDRAYRILK